MLTPSGRFEPGAKICLSISDFHPESWNPLWGVSLILLGLQSFFYENTSTTGALQGVSAAEKRRLAAQSLAYNARNPTYRKLFPELIDAAEERAKQHAEREAAALSAAENSSQGAGHRASAEERRHVAGIHGWKFGGWYGIGWKEALVGVLTLAAAIGVGVVMRSEGLVPGMT